MGMQTVGNCAAPLREELGSPSRAREASLVGTA